jgi:MFS family permease
MNQTTQVLANPRAVTSRNKWQILAACSAIMCINAAFPIYGSSVVNTAMISAMKADRSLLGMFIAANMVVTGLTAPLVGMFVSRFGARPALITGSCMLILGALVMSTLVHSPVAAILTFGIFVGLGMSFGGFIANQACTAGWFHDDRARPFGILYATMGIGGFIAPPLINVVILGAGNWQAGWLVFVVFGLIALCLSVFVVREAPDASEFAYAGGFTASVEPPTLAGQGGIFSVALPIIMICIMSGGASGAFYVAHGLSLLKDFGHPLTAATTTISIMAGSTLAGNLIIGEVGKRFGVRKILALGSITLAAGLLLLGNAHSTALLYLYAPFYGIGFGAVQVGGMALLSKCVKPIRFATISGIVFAADTVCSASTPIFGGIVFDKIHSYLPVVLVLVALNLTAAVLLLLGRKAFPARA